MMGVGLGGCSAERKRARERERERERSEISRILPVTRDQQAESQAGTCNCHAAFSTKAELKQTHIFGSNMKPHGNCNCFIQLYLHLLSTNGLIFFLLYGLCMDHQEGYEPMITMI